MHPISDKELDKLFQKRFGELEVQPSDGVWERISETMDQKSKGKLFRPTIWMAAASVLILISAGLWFYKPAEVIELHGDTKVANQPLSNPELPLVNEAIIVNDDLKKDTHPVKPQIIEVKLALVPTIQSKEIQIPESLPSVEPEIKLPIVKETLVAEVVPTPKKISIAQPVTEAKVPNRYKGDLSTLDVTQPDMMAKAYLPTEESTFSDNENNGQAKIRSVGSLLNFVISRVDKREDKFIEFKDGKEGSQVSGINLGLVKIKGRK